jgi:hypothetical protein
LYIWIFAWSGCAATGDSGGGASHLPVSGSGPFAPLPPDPSLNISAPVVLADATADLDDPSVVAWNDALALWVSVDRRGVKTIEHADANTLLDGFMSLYPAIQADQGWEAGAVAQPSVLWTSPWLMFYAAGGMLGWATAADGHTWVKAPGPALIANTLEEGDSLSSPAVVVIDDRVRVYYLAAGAIWAAEAPADDVLANRSTSWTRVDGKPETPERDPFLARSSFATGLGRFTARAAMTPANRLRHDLYFTATTTTATATATTIGFASSFDGADYHVAAAPILSAKLTTRSPAETPYGDEALLLYVEHLGVRDVIAAATQTSP